MNQAFSEQPTLSTNFLCHAVFASSLLSLISEWGCRPCAAPPRPPPPPRRHSLPPAPPPNYPLPPRHTHTDLRQEIRELNLGTQEFEKWIGDKFDEHERNEFASKFAHDVPLQRTISLDRGVDVFERIRAIGPNSDAGSSWTVYSESWNDLLIERYRSFEDVSASPNVRSRRASLGVNVTALDRHLALAVLRDSYKGLSSGDVSPQIRKLHRCFTFSESFDSKGSSIENLEVSNKPKAKIGLLNDGGPLSPEIRRLKSFSFRGSVESVSSSKDKGSDVRKPFYRSISGEWNRGADGRVGREKMLHLPIKREDGMKKGIVKQEFRSCENLVGKRKRSLDLAMSSSRSLRGNKDLKNSNVVKLKRHLSNLGNPYSKYIVPDIVISNSVADSVAKISDTSNLVDLSSNCECGICTEGEKRYFTPSALSTWFIKIFSCRDLIRKNKWDEINNCSDNEMYKCIIHVLKLLFGLWLRHFDHHKIKVA